MYQVLRLDVIHMPRRSKWCDLVKWNNRTEHWHFVDILFIGPIKQDG